MKHDINNVNDLRDLLATTLTEMLNHDRCVGEAKETANLAGKMINSAKVQVDYYHRIGGEMPEIKFLVERK